MYIVNKKYADAGAVNFTYTDSNKQTNNFVIAEKQEVEPIIKDFITLWIGFKSENVQPVELTVKDILPITPYELAVVQEVNYSPLSRRASQKTTYGLYIPLSLHQ